MHVSIWKGLAALEALCAIEPKWENVSMEALCAECMYMPLHMNKCLALQHGKHVSAAHRKQWQSTFSSGMLCCKMMLPG